MDWLALITIAVILSAAYVFGSAKSQPTSRQMWGYAAFIFLALFVYESWSGR